MKKDFKKTKKVECEVPQNFFNGLCRIAALHSESVQDTMERAMCEFLSHQQELTPAQLQARLDEIAAKYGDG